MSSSALAAAFRHLRGKLAVQQHNDDSDEQLLHAFLNRRDESAFTVLVRRHGPMVLHVCRRVLGHEQDAEDAFQATFLVLARRAARLRKKASLVSWLHGIAYRTALKAKQTAARRRKHEETFPRRACERGVRPPNNPVEELSWHEVQALVDEEVARLPEIFRSVFILCCLEDLSRAEAARRLGLNENTLSSRLAKARQRLQRRLALRGVELTAVLAASTLATQSASALSPILISSTIKAALATASGQGTAGLVSANVAALVKSVASTSMLSKTAMILVLAVGAMAVGAGVVSLREPPIPSAEAPRAEAAKPPDQKPADTVTVRGRVFGPEGKPVKGARLYWPRVPKTEPRTREAFENIEIAERAKSDAEGRFRFELPRSAIHHDWLKNFSLLAVADGYGVDGVELPKKGPVPEVTLRLVKDQPTEGRILSTEGKPLAGVRVRIWGVVKTRQERLDDFLAAWKRQDPGGIKQAIGKQWQQMFLPRHEKSFQAVTDKDGRFRLQGAGCERLALLQLRAPGITPAPLMVVNRAGFDPTAWNKAARDNTPPEARRPEHPSLLYGPKIEYVALAGRRIEGTVREAGSGKSMPGYRITIRVPGSFDITAVSDNEGKYKFLDAPKLKQYMLFAQPPANSAWLPTAARSEDAAGLQPIRVDFTAARGIVVTGRVLDRSTGQGVHAWVRFVPLPGNKFFGEPGYDYYKYAEYKRTRTDVREAGRYQLVVMPGPGVLMVQAIGQKANGGQDLNPYRKAEFDAKDRERFQISESDRFFRSARENYLEFVAMENAVKVLDLAPDAGTMKYDLLLDRGATRTIQIEDADGKPLKGTTVAGVTATWPDAMAIRDASCTIFALDPKKPRRVFFLHAQRHLVGTLLLRGDEKEPVVVRLGRANPVIGRLLDSDGQPLAGADIYLNWNDPVGNQLYGGIQKRPKVRTDKDGRFRFEGIVPELKFNLRFIRGETIFLGDPPINDKQVKLGETLDLGDVRVKPAR